MISRTTNEPDLPYGTNDLDPRVICVSQSPRRVRCFVKGCRHILRTPTRYEKGEACPDHGIFCHFSSGGATYSYADVRRNTIASPDCWHIASFITRSSTNPTGLGRSDPRTC